MKMIVAEVIVIGLVLALASAQPASAGGSDVLPIQILNFGTVTLAHGSFGSTRNDTSDANQYVRCETVINPGGLSQFANGALWSGSCTAHKGAVTVSCNFPDGAQASYQRILSTMTSDSFIQFVANNSTHNCEALTVYQFSSDEPKL
jgi:hypothetical protein